MITVTNLSGDNRALLGNDDYCGRDVSITLGPLAPPPIWRRIRIAMRLCISDLGINAGLAFFRVGLCSGASFYGQGGSNPAHAALFEFIGDAGIGFDYEWIWGPGGPAWYQRRDTFGEVWINGVRTGVSAGAITPATLHYVGATDTNRTLLFCDITRTSPPGAQTLTLNCFYNTSTAVTDVSQAEFEAKSVLLAPTQADHVWGVGSAMVVDETTNGAFTHIQLAWHQSTAIIKVSDVAVVVLSTL